MSNDVDNSRLNELLEGLVTAADQADTQSIAELLVELADEDVPEDDLAEVRSFFEGGDLNRVLEWAGERLMAFSADDPLGGVFDDFDVDDAFLDLEDTGFREPSSPLQESESLDLSALDSESAIELLDEVEDDEQDPGLAVARPHVLSGKFNLVDRAAIEADRQQRSLAESLDDAAVRGEDEEPPDPERQTRPNLGDAEPPDRLTGGSDISDEMATMPPEISEADEPEGEAFRSDDAPSDEFSIEIVADPPSQDDDGDLDALFGEELSEPSAPKESGVKLNAATGFDFGFADDEFESSVASEDKPKSAAAQTKPGPTQEVEVDDEPGDPAERDRNLTPLKQLPSQDPEDMFFELAEALAADSEHGADQQPYRGEPMRAHSAETNPFGNEQPTGTAHLPVPSEASSAAQSHVQTNMNAILLEARRLRSAGELEAALDITKKVLSRGPNDDAESLREQIESELEGSHLARVGALTRTPRLAVDMGSIANLDLDHRAGYIISQVDGIMTFEDLLELSGMSRLETLAVFCDLLDQGVIAVR